MKLFIITTLLIATNAANANFIDSNSADITVLQAWIGKIAMPAVFEFYGQKPSYKLDINNCTTLKRSAATETNGHSYFNVTVDCTEELENVAKLTPDAPVSPLLNRSIFEYIEVPETHTYYQQTGVCETIEFRTVTKNSALQNKTFAGIGFYHASEVDNSSTTSTIIPPDKLHVVGQVTLADGSPATVHRFLMQGFCFGTGGNGSTLLARRYTFKPFAVFVPNTSSTIYRFWDNVSQNYVLGCSSMNGDTNSFFVWSFDRQKELLKN